MCRSQAKRALQYAKDLKNGSEYLAVLATRTVLGNIQILSTEDRTRIAPDKGYDSVCIYLCHHQINNCFSGEREG